MRKSTKTEIFLAIVSIAVFLIFFKAVSEPAYSDSIMDLAHYKPDNTKRFDYGEVWRDEVIMSGIRSKVIFDLDIFLSKPAHDPQTLAGVEDYNDIVNHTFIYRSDETNYWYSERPLEFIVSGSGDCKAFAMFKYHLLKQLGYKNVKIISLLLPDGTGDLDGHVVVLLNDLWVLDINHPYFYPYAYLRANNFLMKAYDDTGVRRVEHDGGR